MHDPSHAATLSSAAGSSCHLGVKEMFRSDGTQYVIIHVAGREVSLIPPKLRCCDSTTPAGAVFSSA